MSAVYVRTRYPDDYAISPDCQAGKHAACVGEAWDATEDAPTGCECDCHDTDDERAPTP